MRLVLRLLACSVVCGCVASAGATKINILDPQGFTTNPITTSPFVIGGTAPFTACTPGELPDPTLVEDGCFAGLNRTGSDWTALELIIPNFGTSFTCNTDDASNQIFPAANCVYDPLANAFDLTFSGGTLSNGELFFITEDDIPPGSFPDVLGIPNLVSASATPEPSSLLLLATGLLVAGCLISARQYEDAR